MCTPGPSCRQRFCEAQTQDIAMSSHPNPSYPIHFFPHTQMNIAIVDNGANLVGFLRMDGAFLGSIDIAIKKVRACE